MDVCLYPFFKLPSAPYLFEVCCLQAWAWLCLGLCLDIFLGQVLILKLFIIELDGSKAVDLEIPFVGIYNELEGFIVLFCSRPSSSILKQDVAAATVLLLMPDDRIQSALVGNAVVDARMLEFGVF